MARNGVHGENSASFEESFARLQEVVQRLSEGNLTLQDALASFEEGMALASRCTQMLDEAELRLRQINAQSVKAASEAMGDLDAAMERGPLVDKSGEASLLAVEFESIEERIVFDAPPQDANLAYSSLPGERRGSQPPQSPQPARRGGRSTGSKPAVDDPNGEPELDPLFDEDD